VADCTNKSIDISFQHLYLKEVDSILVADECWVALASLTKRHPERIGFSSKEILGEVRRESAHPQFRPGVNPHIHLHNVANLPPNTARYRMYYRLEDGTYRLYRPGDRHHHERAGKISPRRDELPVRYHALLDWYESEYCGGKQVSRDTGDDFMARIRGLGKELWKGVDPDRYVEDLRSDWGTVAAAAQSAGAGMRGPGQQRVSGVETGAASVWDRVVRHQGDEFQTITGLPFTYEVEGSSGIWFYRDGQRINRRLGRGELVSALQKCPLHGPTDLREFQDPSYLFGLLTDRRIIGRG
jgi:hypothetical protein